MKFEEFLIESEITDLEKKLKDQDDYLKAPNGKKSNLPEKQWLIVRTKSFKNWFGDWETDNKNSSKIIDENGEPMICYHGTNADFDTFDKKKAGAGNDKGLRGKGFYMSPNKKTSMSYGSSLIEGFVNIRNPFIPEKFKSLADIMSILDIEGSYEEDDFESMISFDNGDFRLYSSTSGNVTSMIKDAGFDGVLYIPKQEIVAFEPNQIKSINNKGSFGKTNNINENEQ